jgi:hypothetical protein
MKGPAGYGRYDDDPEYVGCPWARSDMTPCIARDGDLALTSGLDAMCAGCRQTPEYLVEDLAQGYPPAESLKASSTGPADAANEFALLVRAATEPPGGG